MGPLQYSVVCEPAQEAGGSSRHFRCRRCLLKGCEQFYRPPHPQSRYCSTACRQAARRWRRRQSVRRWRSSEAGKIRRREQSRRYRRRIPLVVLAEPPVPVESPPVEAREGQRPATIPDDFSIFRCQRPGCDEMFLARSACPMQRFCCSLCRQALRNVLDREARYRRRRRQGFRPRRRHARPPPRVRS